MVRSVLCDVGTQTVREAGKGRQWKLGSVPLMGTIRFERDAELAWLETWWRGVTRGGEDAAHNKRKNFALRCLHARGRCVITRLYVNNFRCLVGFEAQFESFVVLCGPNGAGKSSVFDALTLLRDLSMGNAFLGGEGERDIASLEFTNWLGTTVQEFELGMTSEGHEFEYTLHLEQVTRELKPRIKFERATCDKKELYVRDLEGVRFQKASGVQSGFPLDWRQAALASIQPAGERRNIETLQQAMAKLLILRPSPRRIEPESKSEASSPSRSMETLLSWYRFLSQEQEWTDELRESLQNVWPDFKSFKMVDVGVKAKALQLRFDWPGSREPSTLFFEQLSDGQKALIGLYMVRTALARNVLETVLIDEPDNYVGLPELQPWVLSIRELLDEMHQAILISHHPEVLGNAGMEAGRYVWRDNHTSPTRIGPLQIPEGLTAGEAVARGWAHG